ncbi:MAG: penicillin-binding protein 2 [Patescibacteria group bacterium]
MKSKIFDLSGKYKRQWVEDNVLFTKKTGRQTPLPHSNSHVNSSFENKTASWFFIFLSAIFILIAGRIFYLQIIAGSDYRALAERNRQRIIPIPAERGLIYDRNNISLTTNIPSFSIAVVPQDLPRQESKRAPLIKKLAELSNQNEDYIRQILRDYSAYSYESIVIQENIDYDTALKLLISATDLPGIQIQRGSKRHYENFPLAHIIGYIGKLNQTELTNLYQKKYYPSDYIGKTGVEKTYETALRGIFGRKRTEVNALGKEQSVLAEEAPIPGQHVKLAIDLEMQKMLEKIINNSLKASNKDRASGIVMNPNSGEILAMVSLPTFDNNDFSGGISVERYRAYIEDENKPLFNRAIGGSYPSGSSIKPAIAASALQEGIITPATNFLSTGGLRVSKWFFPDWQAGGHGATNVRKALASSVNTFFYYIGGGYKNFIGLGPDKLKMWLEKFGFSRLSGIDLPGENDGFLPSPEWKQNTKNEQWYIGDTYNFSIGQGDVLVSPLQIANMTALIANGGKLMEPHVVHSLIDPVTKKETKIAPRVIRENFISTKNLDTVRHGMRDCVTSGSCQRLASLPFAVAGKTGTAQWNSKKPNHAWFTSFAPFNSPEIVVTILVEEGGEGSAISAPIAYEFYKWWGFAPLRPIK